MHMDWYDRSILNFVLESALLSAPTRKDDTPLEFGLSARRIAQRFDAVVDVYASRELPLEEPDLDLLRRAARYRAAPGAAPAR
jgi:hypothetical protein